MCYTAWEVFVEELLIECVEDLCTHCEPEDLPEALRVWAATNVQPWDLAGDKWRTAIPAGVRLYVDGDENHQGAFNTASIFKIKKLYESVLGYSPTHDVKWNKKSNAAVRQGVQLLVEVRGEIVHKGTTPGNLNLRGARDWASFIGRLCEAIDGKMSNYLSEIKDN